MNASIHKAFRHVTLSAIALAGFTACSTPAPPPLPSSSTVSSVEVDQVEAVNGIPDPTNDDPAVLALEVAGTELCTATLIAPDVILTARHCVSETAAIITCPSSQPQVLSDRPPSSLRVLSGNDVSTAKELALGKQIFVPSTDEICDADIALVLLDKAIKTVDPLDIGTAGVATGEFVNSVGYGRPDDGGPAGTKLVREHVEVLETTTTEFVVGEATCQGDSGGPALDETTGEVLGVVSRGGPTCDGPGVRNIYTRVDAFSALIAEALASSASGADAGTGKPKKTKTDAGATAGQPPLGGPCTTGADCATGVCVDDKGTQYCSRTCSSTDHCPTHFECTAASKSAIDAGEPAKVCLED
jgi:hypothetical protein